MQAVDGAGNLLVSWRGLRLRDAGALPRNAAWPPSLLSVYLERRGAALGLHQSLRVSVQCGLPEPATELPATDAAARQAAAPGPEGAPHPEGVPRPEHGRSPGSGRDGSSGGSGHASVAPGSGCLEGFELSVEADSAAVCSWHAADPQQAGPAADRRLAGLRAELARSFGGPQATQDARLRAIAACLPAVRPSASQIVIDCVTNEDWMVLNADSTVIACTVASISGVSLPVAIAMATGKPDDAGSRPTVRERARTGPR